MATFLEPPLSHCLLADELSRDQKPISGMSKHSVLVVGGCGFLGFHVVRSLKEDSAWSSVHVISRDPSRNRIEGVHYHKGNITSQEQVKSAIAEIQPSLIIHAASPIASENATDERSFQEINVKGTRNLLEAATMDEHVKALLYTSSADVMVGSSHEFVTEDAPVLTKSSRADCYAKTKAEADQMVLDANGNGGLRTMCLRPSAVYGERDSQCIPGTLKALQEGRHRYQIGSNTNLLDVVSATNVAQAHMLAAKFLLNSPISDQKVDGEAFFITDGNPIPFWTFMRKIWSAAGENIAPDEMTIIPAWFMLNFASAMEWFYWTFSFGTKRPKFLRRQTMTYACMPRTYSIEKAKKRLGYSPLDNRDGEIEKGVEWALHMQVHA